MYIARGRDKAGLKRFLLEILVSLVCGGVG